MLDNFTAEDLKLDMARTPSSPSRRAGWARSSLWSGSCGLEPCRLTQLTKWDTNQQPPKWGDEATRRRGTIDDRDGCGSSDT